MLFFMVLIDDTSNYDKSFLFLIIDQFEWVSDWAESIIIIFLAS